MQCPKCEFDTADNYNRCSNCDFGIRPDPKPEVRRPAYLGDAGIESAEEEIAREFRCPHCESYGSRTSRVALADAGFLGVFNMKLREMLVATCTYCSSATLLDCRALDLRPSVWRLFDVAWSVLVFATVIGGAWTLFLYAPWERMFFN